MDLAGLGLPDLPEGVTPLEAVMSVKCLNADGEVMVCERIGLSGWEALGMTVTLADSLRVRLVQRGEE